MQHQQIFLMLRQTFFRKTNCMEITGRSVHTVGSSYAWSLRSGFILSVKERHPFVVCTYCVLYQEALASRILRSRTVVPNLFTPGTGKIFFKCSRTGNKRSVVSIIYICNLSVNQSCRCVTYCKILA